MRAFNVARPRQRNIYQITSSTTCNLHAYNDNYDNNNNNNNNNNNINNNNNDNFISITVYTKVLYRFTI